MLKIACRFSCFLCKAARGFQPRSFIPTELRNGSQMRGKQLSCSWVFRVSECKPVHTGGRPHRHAFLCGSQCSGADGDARCSAGRVWRPGSARRWPSVDPRGRLLLRNGDQPCRPPGADTFLCLILETELHARSPRCAKTISCILLETTLQLNASQIKPPFSHTV